MLYTQTVGKLWTYGFNISSYNTALSSP